MWPDTYVEEANLTIHISAVRKALGETSGEQQLIETVPKRGYRFLAKVTEVLAGEKNEAKAAYQEFLTLCKNADTGIPILQQAKAEYSSLN